MVEKAKEELLEEFSGQLITLGEEIEQRLREKKQLEAQIQLAEKQAMGLEKDIFTARTKLVKLNITLAKLEAQRQEFAEKKLLLEKK